MIEHKMKSGEVILLDDEFAHLTRLAWQLNSVGYARRTVRVKGTGKYKTLLMHRFIIGAVDGQTIDHINGNKLDNRLVNLRICTQSENLGNRHTTKDNKTSDYYGVSKHVERRWKTNAVSWKAQINRNGTHYSKRFFSEIDAAKQYDEWAKKLDGKYARLNFPIV